MSLMAGKKGLVIGIANDRSFAWHIAHRLKNQGAELMFTNLPGEKMERRVRSAVASLEIEDPWMMSLDATNEEDLAKVFNAAAEHAGGRLDFIVHSIAFADKDYLAMGRFHETPKEVYLQAMEVSAYTLVSMTRAALPYMTEGGSILGMTYYGAEKVIPGYNVMGVAKAALECTCRYLAAELGRQNIRVNTISGGPLKTLSAMGVGGFGDMLNIVAERAPLGRNIEGGEVGDTAVWLLSDMSSGVTGQTIYVDAGYCTMGM